MIRRFFTTQASEAMPNKEIWYTTTDGEIYDIPTNATGAFGAGLVSNVYKDGRGVIKFTAPPTYITNITFFGDRLLSVRLPNSVISIANSAFYDCSALYSIELGNGEITFGSYIFNNCTAIKKIVFHGSIDQASSGLCFSSIPSEGISVYYPTDDTTYIDYVINQLMLPATADVNNFYPVTLMSDTTTVIGKELYERCVEIAANSPEETINLPGTVMIDGSEVTYISYFPDFSTTMDIIAGTNEYRLYEDGYLKYGM